MGCNRWCPFGCGKKVYYIHGLQNKIKNKRSSVYECQACLSKFYIFPAKQLKGYIELGDCRYIEKRSKVPIKTQDLLFLEQWKSQKTVLKGGKNEIKKLIE